MCKNMADEGNLPLQTTTPNDNYDEISHLSFFCYTDFLNPFDAE